MADNSAVDTKYESNSPIDFTCDIGSNKPAGEKSKSTVHCSLSTQVLDSVDQLTQARVDFMKDYHNMSHRESNGHINTQSGAATNVSNPDNSLQLSEKDGIVDKETKTSNPNELNDKGKECDPSKVSMDWVNYQYDRLVAGNSKVPITSPNKQKPKSTNLYQTSKSVKEILKEYQNGPLSVDDCSTHHGVPRTCRMPNPIIDLTLPINVSQNNETFDTMSPDIDHLRRTGSSVDADGGDFMKTFTTKSSLSNIVISRSRTPVGSHTHLPATEDKDLTAMTRQDSEVDFRPSFSSFRPDPTDMKSDLPGLGFTFQKERERLLNIDTILRRSPFSSRVGTSDYQPWKSPYGYTSNFFRSELSSNKHASSTSDFEFSSRDWKQSSPSLDNVSVRNATSKPSYGSLGRSSPTASTSRQTGMSRSRDYNSPQSYTSAKTSPVIKNFKKVERTSISSGYGRTTKLAPKYTLKTGGHSKKLTQFNTRNNINMSKALTENRAAKHNRHSVVPQKNKSSSHMWDDEKEMKDANLNKGTFNKVSNKVQFSKSSSCVGNMKYKESKKKSSTGKYQPYQPTFIQAKVPTTLNRANSEFFDIRRSQSKEFVLGNSETDPAFESNLKSQSWSANLLEGLRLGNIGKPTRSAPKYEENSDICSTFSQSLHSLHSRSDESYKDPTDGIKPNHKPPKKAKGKNKKTMHKGLKSKKMVEKPPFKF